MGKRGKQGHLPQVLIPYDEDSTQNKTASRSKKPMAHSARNPVRIRSGPVEK
jgi:hypothetical protein